LVQRVIRASDMASFDDPEVCRNILESLPTGICVLDRQNRILLWSAGAERMTGHLRHEVLGHSCIAEPLLHCDQPGCEFCGEHCPAAHTLKTSHPTHTSGFIHHKSGHEIPVRIRALPVHNQHGSVIGAVELFEELHPDATRDPGDVASPTPDAVDEVTGLASRTTMQSHLQALLTSCMTHDSSPRILLVHVMGLAQFRANLGPEAAFSLLRVMARTLESCLGSADLIGRWTEQQFLVIVNRCQEESADTLRERLRRILAGQAIEWWGERRSLPVFIGASTPQADDTVQTLVQRAQMSVDAAMLPARRSWPCTPSGSS
jgi:diguanylate cyclase (GGDEF)-like protein/PAS domain S-box-containing protein